MNTKKVFLNTWDRLTAAITFAEAGEADTAREILNSSKQEQKRKTERVEDQKDVRCELRL